MDFTNEDAQRQAAHALALEFARQHAAPTARPADYANAYSGAYREIMAVFKKDEHAQKGFFA